MGIERHVARDADRATHFPEVGRGDRGTVSIGLAARIGSRDGGGPSVAGLRRFERSIGGGDGVRAGPVVQDHDVGLDAGTVLVLERDRAGFEGRRIIVDDRSVRLARVDDLLRGEDGLDILAHLLKGHRRSRRVPVRRIFGPAVGQEAGRQRAGAGIVHHGVEQIADVVRLDEDRDRRRLAVAIEVDGQTRVVMAGLVDDDVDGEVARREGDGIIVGYNARLEAVANVVVVQVVDGQGPAVAEGGVGDGDEDGLALLRLPFVAVRIPDRNVVAGKLRLAGGSAPGRRLGTASEAQLRRGRTLVDSNNAASDR